MSDPNPYSRTMLDALNIKRHFHLGHVYAGTVPRAEVERRRRRDKAARAARRIARRTK